MMIGRDGERHLDSCDGDCSCSDVFIDAPTFDDVHDPAKPCPVGDMIVLHGAWLTIGGAPSFMISEKLARQLREYCEGIEERQVNGGGSSTN